MAPAHTIESMSDAARALVETDWEADDPYHAPWVIRHPSDKDPDTGKPVVLHQGHGHDDFVRLGMPRFCENIAAEEQTRSEREATAKREADDKAEFEAWRLRQRDPQAAAEQERENAEREQWLREREAQQHTS